MKYGNGVWDSGTDWDCYTIYPSMGKIYGQNALTEIATKQRKS